MIERDEGLSDDKNNQYMAKKNKKHTPVNYPDPHLTCEEDIDNWLKHAHNDTKQQLQGRMACLRFLPHDNYKLRDYLIRRIHGLIEAYDDRELLEKAQRATDRRSHFERYTPNDEFHKPFIVYIPAGGQNKKR